MNFFTYFLRRLLLVIPLLLGITVVAFIVANAVARRPHQRQPAGKRAQ